MQTGQEIASKMKLIKAKKSMRENDGIPGGFCNLQHLSNLSLAVMVAHHTWHVSQHNRFRLLGQDHWYEGLEIFEVYGGMKIGGFCHNGETELVCIESASVVVCTVGNP